MNPLIEKIRHLCYTKPTPSILVIGDLMIDEYIRGQAYRLSPEAPVPVVNVSNHQFDLGGAGNVVKNLAALGARVRIMGVTGNDSSARRILQLMGQYKNVTNDIVKDGSRNTTVKARVICGNHQLLRIDHETHQAISLAIEDELVNRLTTCIDDADIVVLSDYNKGLLTVSITRRIIELATHAGKKVIVDPKGSNFQKYRGAYLIKPNRLELALAARMDSLNDEESLKIAADIILGQTEAEQLVVTLSEDGLMIFGENKFQSLPVKAREVFDVTGAGDTVLACIAYFLCLEFTLGEACELANHAAALVIRKVGSVSASVEDIINELNWHSIQSVQSQTY